MTNTTSHNAVVLGPYLPVNNQQFWPATIGDTICNMNDQSTGYTALALAAYNIVHNRG